MTGHKKALIDTYKSQWTHFVDSGYYERHQKEKYPLEWIDNRIFRVIPKVRKLASLLGKRAQGVDFYRYYSRVLKEKDHSKWSDEFERVQQQLQNYELTMKDKEILDISGEPGLFAADASAICARVDVTAFADNVTTAMEKCLSIDTKTYDFNNDNLVEIYKNRKFDFIFSRYGIGFCQDLRNFVESCDQILADDGIIYISFSPASRAVCARWMFDDYTYLRQYTQEFVSDVFFNQGFFQLGEFDEGKFLWDDGIHPIQKFFASFYTQKIFHGVDSSEQYQRNVALIFNRDK